MLMFLCSIFMEERLERLTKSISVLDLEMADTGNKVEGLEENDEMTVKLSTKHISEDDTVSKHISEDDTNETVVTSQSCSSGTTASTTVNDVGSQLANSDLEGISSTLRDDTDDSLTIISYEKDTIASDKEPIVTKQNYEASDTDVDNSSTSKPTMEKSIPGAVWPLLRHQQFESSELSCRYVIAFALALTILCLSWDKVFASYESIIA